MRKHGISGGTFYKWKAKYGGLDVSDARRLKALEDENAKLKKLLADAMLVTFSEAGQRAQLRPKQKATHRANQPLTKMVTLSRRLRRSSQQSARTAAHRAPIAALRLVRNTKGGRALSRPALDEFGDG